MSIRHEKEKGVNVQVLLRCRPFSNDELRNNAPQVVTCNEYQREVSVSQSIAGKHIDRVFMFDGVFGPNAHQKDLYEQAVVPIVNEVLEGFNCTIFAYGQTGTRKTYTMEGECKRSKSGPNGKLPSGAGVVPRAVKQIFDTLEGQNAEYSKKQLPLMEDGKGGVLVRGLEEEIVRSASEIFTLLERGSAKRRTAETLLNKQSSRSHSLFCITIHMKEATPEGEELIKCGKLNLVDLAGSENISRSGAREGRAREAGEINKSLLTLGRVINALVEHLGHVPYRESKLTRLLRDSLGGRTKTCIIATVSPAVHCLEETLSTLDYAHMAKNIKNKPEVNQKMMKSTLIKDLYGEIERLKAEDYATREKNGVHIPKERYYQEESNRKAMADQIEQMGVTIVNHRKQIEELQAKYHGKVQHCTDLSNKLDATEKNLNQTSRLLTNTEDELKRSREDKLNADNRSTVNSFQADLSQQLDTLCNLLAGSMSHQSEHLQCVENICNSFLKIHDKAVIELKKKLTASRALYISHFEAIQNVVRLHKAGNNVALDEMLALASSNSHSIRERCNASIENLTSTSESLHGFLQNLLEESRRLENHATKVDEVQTKCIAEFQKAYESRLNGEKLIADMTTLVSDCTRRQKEMVDARLGDFNDSVTGNKMFLDRHVSAMEGITTDLKRKWQDCCTQAESNFKDNADFSAAKHCRMELLLQKCVNTTDTTLKKWERTLQSLNDMESQNASRLASHVRNMSDSNERHDAEVESARLTAEEDIRKNSEDIIQHYVGLSEQERLSVSEIVTASRTHSETLENLKRDHSQQSTSIEQQVIDTFSKNYKDYKPTGTTPFRGEPDIPSKGVIESLCSMLMEALQEEFRENHSYESLKVKEVKPSLIPRALLSQIN
ncbi:hypothetical protein BUALT_Bualt09G0095700 [Buddleja alternifolia]|uniref:Kinesin-like protein n=1 Tax=Buddleja alternifolia TaxID=168488 RepID=A0AAV6X5L6_9LAMI|nr:hypothetical protein BUALT_Bualt09G0095700 [Buddleja alternifolia]